MEESTMELYQKTLLQKFIHDQSMDFDPEKIILNECYQALLKIKSIVEDERLDDPECFFESSRLYKRLKKLVQMVVSVMILGNSSVCHAYQQHKLPSFFRDGNGTKESNTAEGHTL